MEVRKTVGKSFYDPKRILLQKTERSAFRHSTPPFGLNFENGGDSFVCVAETLRATIYTQENGVHFVLLLDSNTIIVLS